MDVTENQQVPERRIVSLAAALLNLSGFSLGYFYLKLNRRAVLHLAITLVVILLGIFTPQLHISVLVVIALILWLIWMAVDGFRLARKSDAPAKLPLWTAYLVGGLALAGIVLGFILYGSAARNLYAQGVQEYNQSNYPAARDALFSYVNYYHLSLDGNQTAAEELLAECQILAQAVESKTAGDYLNSIQVNQDYLQTYPQSEKSAEINETIAQTYLDWAASLTGQEDYAGAIKRYQKLSSSHPNSKAAARVHPLLGESHLNYAQQLHSQGDYTQALDEYTLVLTEFADTAYTDEAQKGLDQVHYDLAAQYANDGDFEKAIGELDIILAQPASELFLAATETNAKNWLDWGEQLAAEKDYLQAITCFETVIADYPASKDQAAVRAAELYLAYGQERLLAGSYEEAVTSLDTILSLYPTSDVVAEARVLIAEALLKWGQELAGKDQYGLALAKFDRVLSAFNDTPSGAATRKASGEVRLTAAEYFRQTGLYDQAFTMYSQLVDKFSDLPQAQIALEALPDFYISWALNQSQQGQFARAIELLNTLMQDYPDSAAAAQVVEIKVEFYIAWGNDLIAKSKFTQAMETLNQATGLFTEKDQKDRLKVVYDEALLALSNDTGKEGTDLMDEAEEVSCKEVAFDNPAIGISTAQRLARDCGPTAYLNPEQRASNPGNFYYVVTTESDVITLQICPYTGGHTLIRKAYSLKVTLISVRTGRVYRTQTFYGTYPPGCPYMHGFSGFTDEHYGEWVDRDKVTNWLNSYLKP
jgi:tetratricopeptide (TPR) repeat protein/TM2 domain-containing membrane protein YozV